MKIFIAMMESESKSWVGTGLTEKQARQVIRDLWNENQKQCAENIPGFNPTYVKNFRRETGSPFDEYYGISVEEVEVGKGFVR